MPPTDHVTDLVDDYVHELLNTRQERQVERHCAHCRDCAAALDQARQRFTLLQNVPVHEPSRDLVNSTLAHITRQDTLRRRWKRRVGYGYIMAASAAALLLAVLTFHNQTRTATPPDLVVLGQREWIAGAPASLRIRLTNHETGKPLANVPVQVQLQPRGAQAGSDSPAWDFTTDEHGTFVSHLDVPDWADGNYELRVVAKTDQGEEVVTKEIQLRRAEKVMLSTDKPVYQPGQTIHLRALALRRSTLKPVNDQPATFAIRDPKNNVIFKKTLPTSAFGIAALDCPLAQEILEGAYTIDCSAGTTTSSLTVKVFKYVLPKFKVEAKLDRPYYQPGETVKASVEAGYFFGKPVANGQVDVNAFLDGNETVFKARLRLDANGKTEIEFGLPEQPQFSERTGGDSRLTVQWSVIDTAEQKHATEVSRVVTKQPLKVDVLPENGILVPGVANKIYLLTTYADGSVAPCQLTVAGNYETRTSALGVASIDFTPDSGTVSLEVVARAENGLRLRRIVEIAVGQPGQEYLLRTDKVVYNGGEKMHLSVHGAGIEPVFLDILKEGQTLHTAIVDVKDGQGTLDLDLAPEWAGTLQLFAYRFVPVSRSAKKEVVGKVRTVYVRPANQLQIKASADKTEYRPGETAQLKFTLVDAQGKGVPGAISLAGVDEAVFAVNSGAPGMERAFYLLEKKLLEPVYALHPWSPDLPTDADRQQLEQALFSRTVQRIETQQPFGLTMGRTQVTMEPTRRVSERAVTPKLQMIPTPHTLNSDTYPQKHEKMLAEQSTQQQYLNRSWLFLGLSVLLAAYVSVWLVVSRQVLIVMHIVGGIGLFSLACIAPLFWLTASRSKSEAMMARDQAGMAVGMAEMASPTSFASNKKESDGQGPRAPLTPPSVTDPTTPAPRLREWFPETLLWQPELVTDNDGNLIVPVQLADSITTWRISASAVTRAGALGATRHDVRVFQSFFADLNLPVSLTRGDEVTIPVTVYNYLKERQTVKLKLEKAGWFELLDDAEKQVDLNSGEVRAVGYRVKVTRVGEHTLQVSAFANHVADALKRKIDVIPDGYKVETVHNGTLQHPVELPLDLPDDAIEGSARVIVKVYPSTFSQLVEGMENIFQMPNGCFEQTSSTTYPNVLALDYLKATGKRNPEVEAKARQYIHLGYQRLLGFEVQGGGFDWYGKGPANVSLTAYGLLEFQDMARVHDVDPRLLQRTRQWLLAQRDDDGSWSKAAQGRRFHGAGGSGYALTAYVAWAVFSDPAAVTSADPTRRYLLSFKPDELTDPYVLAVACNALLAIDPTGADAKPYLDRLEALKQMSEDHKNVWWTQAVGGETMFYGRGDSGSVETTALATLARITAKREPSLTRAAMTWLVQKKDGRGTWGSTQATVYALKALISGTGNLGGEKERTFEIALGSKQEALKVPVDQAEVLQQLDLTPALQTGKQTLRLKEGSDTAATYQVVFRYHVPTPPSSTNEPLSVELAYDRATLKVSETLKMKATVKNNRQAVAPMVMLTLPIPAGFRIAADDLERLVANRTIDRYQITPSRVIVYLRQLERGKPLELHYQLQATLAVKLSVPGAHIYEYYDPKQEARSAPTKLSVIP